MQWMRTIAGILATLKPVAASSLRVSMLTLMIMTMTMNVSSASMELLPPRAVASRHLSSPRTVQIALPASYRVSLERRYPVIYLHDGQNVLSSAGPHSCFGWGSWQVDITAAREAAEGRAREVILVAVDHSTNRYVEYRGPARAYSREELNSLIRRPTAAGDNTAYHAYRQFLVDELKPAIDSEFRTLPGPEETAVVGSSMGGICSLVLGWERPDVFGQVASLSGAFQVERTNFLSTVLAVHRGGRKPFRCYLDSGVIDFTGEDDGRALTAKVAEHLKRIGWRQGVDLDYFVDEHPLKPEQLVNLGLPQSKWQEAGSSQHNEFYWRLRFGRALRFMFPVRQDAR